MEHTISLSGYEPSPKKLKLGTNDSYGVEKIIFTRGAEWDGLSIVTVWHPPGGAKPVRKAAFTDDTVDVPKEATATAGRDGVLVVEGLKAGVRLISYNISYKITEQDGVEGDDAPEPTPDLVQQAISAAERAEGLAKTAQESADTAAKEADNARKASEESAKQAEAAKEEAAAAKPQAEAAAASAKAAKESEDAAKASSDAAADSASAAQSSAETATDAAQNAQSAKTYAENAAEAAADSANHAAASENAAASSAKTSVDAAAAAAASAEKAAASETAAKASETAAGKSETAAAASQKAAEDAAKQAQSVTQGAKGWYPDESALNAAHPTAKDGDWAIVGTTDSIWVWDSDTGKWKDSGNAMRFADYYTKSQIDAMKTKLLTVTAPAAGWVAGSYAVAWDDGTATTYAYRNRVTVESVTANSRLAVSQRTQPTDAVRQVAALEAGAGVVDFYADSAVSADAVFVVEVTAG